MTEIINNIDYLVDFADKHELDVSLAKQGTSKLFVCTLHRKDGEPILFNKTFVQAISTNTAEFLPEGLEIEVKDVVFATSKNRGTSKLIFAMSFGKELSLAKLPFIGDKFPKDQMMGVDGFQFIVSSADCAEWEVQAINQMLAEDTMTLPQVLSAGMNFSADVQISGMKEQLCLAATEEKYNSPEQVISGSTELVSATPSVQEREITQLGMTKWISVNKNLGALTIKRVGARYYNKKFHLMLDTKLKMGAMTLTLDGVSAGSKIRPFKPEFNLDGIGLSYKKGLTQVSGALLRNAIDDSYQGMALIKTASMTISALGAYKNINGVPSVFVYGVVSRAVGVGPPWFHVTGMAAGFGYNRSIKVPDVKDIEKFPLVAVATGEKSYSDDPLTALRSMQSHIPTSVGDMCLAFGIKFTTFKQINSFALMILNLTGKVKLDVIGISKLRLPSKGKPLAEIAMAYKATYDFYENVLKVDGALTPSSYIIDKKCKLSGGFAFYTWAAGPHAGDFVLSMGGYHPSFKKPAHYPSVPRLALHWKINQYLNVTGSMYYAMVPSGMMAGGRLEALFSFKKSTKFDFKLLGVKVAGVSLSGEVRASFVVAADFIIAWMPYAYEAALKVGIGIKVKFKGSAYVNLAFKTVRKSVSKSFNLNISTGVRIWGPEFAGIAHVDWKIVSFDIKFGNQSKSAPEPLSWNGFKEAFLPPANEILSVAINDGLLKTLNSGMSVINPANLAISVNSIIPANKIFNSAHSTYTSYENKIRACEASIKTNQGKIASHNNSKEKKVAKRTQVEQLISLSKFWFFSLPNSQLQELKQQVATYNSDIKKHNTSINQLTQAIVVSRTEITSIKDALAGNLNQRPTPGARDTFGIAAMDVQSVSESYQFIRVLDLDNNNMDVSEQFIIKPLLKNAPKSLWGDSFKAKPGKDNLIRNMLMGIEITPKPKKKPLETEEKFVTDFSYDIELKDKSFIWKPSLAFIDQAYSVQQRRGLIQGINDVNEHRTNLFTEMGLDPDWFDCQQLEKNTDNAFLRAPKIVNI
ncbi:MAG: hypothetical protein ACI9LM_003445 [Alteromonadaceae bacterium]|jgi:hypothetical protein